MENGDQPPGGGRPRVAVQEDNPLQRSHYILMEMESQPKIKYKR